MRLEIELVDGGVEHRYAIGTTGAFGFASCALEGFARNLCLVENRLFALAGQTANAPFVYAPPP